jgi:prepilin-type N-terminal cleavage/methylation domain-containing protein
MILFSKGGISMFQLTSPKKQKAFTLVELLTVMVVLVALATITVKSTAQFSFDSRYQITQDHYDKIKTAILGNPNQTINGHPSVSGFVADMGRLPNCLRELIDGYDCETQGSCSNATYNNQKTNCLGNAGTWTPYTAWTYTPWQTVYLNAYCSNSSYLNQIDCEAHTATWVTGTCYDPTMPSASCTTPNFLNVSLNACNVTTLRTSNSCTAATSHNSTQSNVWVSFTGLGYGWRGAYISITNDPTNTNSFSDGWGRTAQGVCYNNAGVPILNHTDSATCIAADATNIWDATNDFNYGWYYWRNVNELTILSYGKNQTYDPLIPSDEYDKDFPQSTIPTVRANDWEVTLPSTVTVTTITPALVTIKPSVVGTTTATISINNGASFQIAYTSPATTVTIPLCFVTYGENGVISTPVLPSTPINFTVLSSLTVGTAQTSTAQTVATPITFTVSPPATPLAYGQIAYSINFYDSVTSQCTSNVVPSTSNPNALPIILTNPARQPVVFPSTTW